MKWNFPIFIVIIIIWILNTDAKMSADVMILVSCHGMAFEEGKDMFRTKNGKKRNETNRMIVYDEWRIW